MSVSLFSASWYRVAELKIRMRKHADIHRHQYRGKTWYVLQDHVTGQFQRFSPEAYQIIGLMDGRRTLQQIWDVACKRLGDGMPTQDEVIQLVAQLNRANVIQSDILPDIEELQVRRREQAQKKIIQQLKSPLSIRIPMMDPEGFLSSTMWLVRPFYSWFGLFLWAAIVLFGLVLSIVHWEALTENISDRVLAVENLLLIALVYPFVKVIHELGHAYAVKRWGGEVHEVGVMLLVLFPVPYVDASAATAFRNKYQRMLVGAIGIMVELMVAAIAMMVWVLAEPGIVRAVAFNTMLIGGFSTLLFNGNPLLRFDAYYVLADFLEIPNLASRGNSQVAYLTKKYLYGVKKLTSPANSASEGTWLACYASAAYIYRLFVMVAIALFVATQYFVIGSILAFWSIWATLLMPVLKTITKPATDPELRSKKGRVLTISALILGTLVGLVAFLPAPYKTQTEGVLWVPQDAYVRSHVSGFVESLEVSSGKPVTHGQLLLQLSAPDLEAKVDVLKAQIDEAEIRLEASLRDRAASEILREELQFIQREYQRALERLKGVKLYSPATGEFVVPDAHRILGRYVHRGELIGYVVDYNELSLVAMVSEDEIDQVRTQNRSVELRFASNPNEIYKGEIVRALPATTQQLPSKVLSTDGGGRIALDPKSEDGLKSFRSHFRIDLSVIDAPKNRYDERVYVLIEHDPEPLIYRWYRAVRRVFLRQFDV